jgi:hypothetical protein
MKLWPCTCRTLLNLFVPLKCKINQIIFLNYLMQICPSATVDVWAGEMRAGMNASHCVASTVLYYHLLSPPCHSMSSIEDVTNVPNMSAPDLCQNGSAHAIQIDPATSHLIGSITYDQGLGFNLNGILKKPSRIGLTMSRQPNPLS